MNMAEDRKIVERFGGLVYRIAYARMRSREDAEDIYQEVFMTYAKKRPRFEDEYKAAAWFSKTTVNHCKLLWRSKKRHDTRPLEEAEGLATVQNDTLELMLALETLPEKYRKVIELFYFSGLSAAETGQVLGISENAVRLRLSRGRKMLEEKLK